MNVLSLSVFFLFLTSFFSLQFQDIDGNNISMSSFEGKKILIVNIATESDSIKIAQLTGLEQLQQRYPDSLVIIAFPSNSFGNESHTDSAIKQICQANYHTSFIIASKVNVTGTTIHPVFNWLAHKSENGDMNASVHNDFQKFLINKQGNLVGVLSPKVTPLDSLMVKAITANY